MAAYGGLGWAWTSGGVSLGLALRLRCGHGSCFFTELSQPVITVILNILKFEYGSRTTVRKNFKLLKYEHIIYHFESRGPEISNIYYFRENMSKTDFAKFLKVFIKSRNLIISRK